MKSRPTKSGSVTIGLTKDGQRITLTSRQRATGVDIIGAPDSGKSKLAEFMIRQDIDGPHSVIVIDPHESLYRAAVSYCAWRRPRRPVYLCDLSAGDPVLPVGLLTATDGDLSVLVDRCVEGTIKSWGMANTDETPRLDKWLRAFFSVVIERGLPIDAAAQLLDFYAGNVRRYLTANTTVEHVWRELNEPKLTPTQFDDKLGSTKNRLQRFTSVRSVRRFLGVADATVTLDLLHLMDTGGILLVNLKPSPNLSPMAARCYGTLLVTRIFDAARRRAVPDGGEHQKPCFTYIDECQNFLTLDIAEMLAQGRKMGLALHCIHQTREQIRSEDPRILAALDGAARTKIAFAIGSNVDAAELVHELFPGQIDYNEIKRTDYERRFEPVATRETTRSVSVSGATSRAHGETEVHTESSSVTTARSQAGTISHAVAEGTSSSRGHGTSESQTQITGLSSGVSSGESVGAGMAMQVPINGDGGFTSASEFSGVSSGEFNAMSEATADGSGSFESETESESSMEQWGQSETIGETYAETEGSSDAYGTSKTKTVTKNQSVSVGDVPVTKHKLHFHPVHTLHSVDEQRQRKADELRRLPQRVCVVRYPDGTAHQPTVVEVKPTPLSARRVADYKAERARKTQALSGGAVDALIQERRIRIEAEAEEFAAQGAGALDFLEYDGHRSTGRRKPPKRLPKLDPVEQAGVAQRPRRKKG